MAGFLLCYKLGGGETRGLFELLLEITAVAEATVLGNSLVAPFGMLTKHALGLFNTQIGEPFAIVTA